ERVMVCGVAKTVGSKVIVQVATVASASAIAWRRSVLPTTGVSVALLTVNAFWPGIRLRLFGFALSLNWAMKRAGRPVALLNMVLLRVLNVTIWSFVVIPGWKPLSRLTFRVPPSVAVPLTFS